MKIRGRVLVLAVSMPVIAFAVVGGFMSKAHRAPGQLSVPAHLRRRRVADPQQLRRGSERRQGDARRDARARRRPRSGQRVSRRGQVKVFEKGDLGGAGADRPRTDATVLPARDRGARRLAGGEGRLDAGRLHPRHRRPVDARHHGLRRPAAAARQARHQGAPHGAARQRRRAARDRPGARRAAGHRGEVADRRAGRRLPAHRGVRQDHAGSDQERDRVARPRPARRA